MSAERFMIGLRYAYIGDVLETGSMPNISEMVSIGNIVPDSVDVTPEEDTYTDLKDQRTNGVDISILSEKGAEIIKFATRDFDAENLKAGFGGGLAGSIWQAPTSAFKGREKSIKLITKAEKGLHFVLDYPRTKFRALLTGALVETESAAINFQGTLLMPNNQSTGVDTSPKQMYQKPAAPPELVVDDTLKSALFDTVENFEDVTKYEYSVDGGVSFSAVTTNPITSLPATPAGDLQVRVKANDVENGYVEGFVVVSTEEITA